MSKQDKHPPRLALSFFRWYCRPDRLEELEGDILELYDMRIAKMPSWKVDLRFWWDVIRCFKSYSRKSNYLMDTSGALYRSYAKLAFRQMIKNKGPIAANILGLGLALAFCITVYMIYAFNMEFDDFHANTENVFRIHGMKQNGDQLERYETTPVAMEEAILNDIASVTDVTSYFGLRSTVKNGEQYYSEYVGCASPNFLDFFEFPLESGSTITFRDPNSIFLTRETSIKYFGHVNSVGEELTIYLPENEKITAIVGGVFKKVPLNSSFDFNALMNRDRVFAAQKISAIDWSNKKNAGQYIELTDANNRQTAETSLQRYIERQNEGHEEWKLNRFEVIPFKDPLIASHLLADTDTNGRIDPNATLVFNILAVLILFIACFNMANTTMALIAKRVKEIGVRKTLGSFNHQIFFQFIFEMFISMALAFVLAILLTDVLAEEIWGLFGVSFLLKDIGTLGVSLFVTAFLLLATLITGLFPALYAWKFQPVTILNHKQELKGIGNLHKILTVAQYSFSIAVLVTGFFASRNSKFLENMDYGYDNTNLVSLKVEDHNEYTGLKQQIDALPMTDYSFGSVHQIATHIPRSIYQKDTFSTGVLVQHVGAEFLTKMKVNFIHGRDFIVGSESDIENSVIVNEEFAYQYLEAGSPLNATVKIDGERYSVIGVVSGIINGQVYQDYRSEPIVYSMSSEEDYKLLAIKVNLDDRKQVESILSKIWAGSIDRPFNPQWQEDLSFKRTMGDSQSIQTLFLWLAGLGCILSIIGITSLATLNVAKKTKEISIRKVLGATVYQLILKINRPFMSVLGLSLVAGVGLGYLISDLIFSNIYRYHLDFNYFEGLPLGLFIVGVALLMTTVSILKPASASPTAGLRTE